MRSPCPIANALDLLGDKWTLLVVRDMMMFGKSRYAELRDSDEGIATNILADRLKRLEEAGIAERVPYQDRPARHGYRLTAKGRDLAPVLQSLAKWAITHLPDVATEPPAGAVMPGASPPSPPPASPSPSEDR
ncbi:MAG: helix-turn-helix transcriptional regulator [Hyphomicrobiales bacterium]|nr:helix-turn-helix transcriptional regulator [Hyphomicrobiales bacterium]MCP5374246.1 helix-turn-helix transcriptional regulator [Hyphomicrobiales bacterium]